MAVGTGASIGALSTLRHLHRLVGRARDTGHARLAPNLPAPHLFFQEYGSLAKVRAAGGREVSLEFAAYTGICCSHRFSAKIAADGSALVGEFLPGTNQAPYSASFIKMGGDSCVGGAALLR
jgi:hypothetical protein